MSDTMLMFKPDCFNSDSSYSFQEILRDTMRISEFGQSVYASNNGEGWAMDLGAKVHLTHNMAEKLYAEHVDKPFYEGLITFASSGPSFVSVWSSAADDTWIFGRDIVSDIRGRYGMSDPKLGPANIIHGSDGLESANREVQWALRCIMLQCASEEE